MRTILVLLLLLFIYPTTPALSQMYKWVDENGRLNFSDTPPGGRSDVEVYIPTPAYSTTDLPETKTDYSNTTNRNQAAQETTKKKRPS